MYGRHFDLYVAVFVGILSCTACLGSWHVFASLQALDALGGVSSERDGTKRREVIYGRKNGMALTMDILEPKDSNGRGVIWVVSGRGRSSHAKTRSVSFMARVRLLLEAGYTVFAVVHSNGRSFGLPDHVQDVRRAVRFIRHNARSFGIDEAEIGIAGSSSGGCLALMVATTGDAGDPESADPVERRSSRVQAAGCFFPPTDFVDYGGPGVSIVDLMKKQGPVDDSFIFYRKSKSTGESIAIRDRDEISRILGEYSPIRNVSKDDAPTLIIHGEADRAVPFEQSVRMAGELQKEGVPAKLVARKNKGHAWLGWQEDSALLTKWFDEYLKPGRSRG